MPHTVASCASSISTVTNSVNASIAVVPVNSPRFVTSDINSTVYPCIMQSDRDNSGFITAGVVGGLLILFVIFKTILVYIFIRKRNTICNKRSLQFIKIIKQSLSVAAEKCRNRKNIIPENDRE